MDTAQDIYDSTVVQLKIVNPGVEFVTEGTMRLHRVADGRIVAPDLSDGSGREKSSAKDDQSMPM